MTAPATSTNPSVGWIGLGDQGLPMARAVIRAGFTLHVWARTASDLDYLSDVPHVPAGSLTELAGVCDVVEMCVGTDDDVRQLATGLLDGLRPGSILVNHGTGLPSNAALLAQMCANFGVHVLDAPVSGGRPAAEEYRLTTMVGGPQSAAARCQPIFASFSRHVIHLGDAGAGQQAKLLNNALLMMNQAAVAEVLTLAVELKLDPIQLVEVLKVCSGSSNALMLLNTMVTPKNVEHLTDVQVLDMELFDHAMREASIDSTASTERGLVGAHRLAELISRLNP